MTGALWVIATLFGATGQVARNVAQTRLTRQIGTIGATQVRFLFGLPFAILFLVLVRAFTGEALPALPMRAIGITAIGAIAQIGATAMMLKVMQARSFAVTTAWLKTEPVLIALAGATVLGDPLGWPALAAIGVATAGVMLTALKPGTERALLTEAGPAVSGLVAAALFGAAAIGFRGGILALPSGGFLMRATVTLVLSLALQTAILIIWMLLFDRAALTGSFRVWRSSLGAGFLGAAASQCWFIGFSLTSAANVRTLALVEVILAQAVGILWLKQKVSARQIAGMAGIVLGVGLLLRTQLQG